MEVELRSQPRIGYRSSIPTFVRQASGSHPPSRAQYFQKSFRKASQLAASKTAFKYSSSRSGLAIAWSDVETAWERCCQVLGRSRLLGPLAQVGGLGRRFAGGHQTPPCPDSPERRQNRRAALKADGGQCASLTELPVAAILTNLSSMTLHGPHPRPLSQVWERGETAENPYGALFPCPQSWG